MSRYTPSWGVTFSISLKCPQIPPIFIFQWFFTKIETLATPATRILRKPGESSQQ